MKQVKKTIFKSRISLLSIYSLNLIVITRIVIDKDILGWSDTHTEEILSQYQEIIKVNEDNTRLPPTSSDAKIASFCKDEICDLFTADKKFYTDFFTDERIKRVQISRYTYWDVGQKPIFLIQIV